MYLGCDLERCQLGTCFNHYHVKPTKTSWAAGGGGGRAGEKKH